MMMSDTIAALCAAIDAGDDAVLPILADAMEEVGSQTDSLRDIARRHKPAAVKLHVTLYGWQNGYGHAHSIGQYYGDGRRIFESLDRARNVTRYGDWFLFPNRSAAYLILAVAMTQP